MDFRIAREEDQADIEWLWDYCFEKREEYFFRWFFTEYYKTENVLAGYVNGRMTSCLHLMPYRLFLRGAALPASYFVGLAAFPEFRGEGGARRLLQAALQEARRRGHYVNVLIPFKAGYYYPLRWELCYHHYKYILPLEELRDIATAGGNFHLVQDHGTDCHALQAVYEGFTADKHGYALRDEHYWRRIIGEHNTARGFAYLLKIGDAPAGYVFYHLLDRRLAVREMAWTGETAQRALFYFLYNHRSQVKQLDWHAPLDDLTYFRLPDPQKRVMLYPFMAGRVVDVVGALTAINYAAGVSLRTVLEIQDELAPWNNQVIEVEIFGGRGQCRPAKKSEPEFQCDIGAFSQLFFGRICAKNLHKVGKIRTNFPGNIEKLDILFPPCNNYINEYY